MKSIIASIFHFGVAFIKWARSLWWNAFRSSRLTKIKVTDGVKIGFTGYGFIPLKLYENEPLIRLGKGFERKTVDLLLELAGNRIVFFDIGANIGLYSLLIGTQRSSGDLTIHAFEPVRETYSALVENIRINGLNEVIFAHNIGFSDAPGKMEMETPIEYRKKRNDDVFKSLLPAGASSNSTESSLVDILTVDGFCESEGIDRLDLIKIDIEGAELPCFRGAESTIRNLRPLIVLECYEPYCARFSYTVQDLVMYLSGLDYRLLQYEPSQWLAVPAEKWSTRFSEKALS